MARGLLTLHGANKMHHDIKPGNVFIKTDGQSFTVLLGDFSFVAQAAAAGTTEAVLRDVVGTGTPHFRSPEQRDFSEVYQAQVVHYWGEKKEFALCITDPKFERTISSAQDRLVFSTNNDGRLYTIKDIYARQGLNWFVTLHENDVDLRGKFSQSEKPTQIIIYKIPSLSSDVFGFGALAYDLMSAGRSAERFYEAVRTVDYPKTTHSIRGIVAAYERYCEQRAREPGAEPYREIFSRFAPEDRPDACPAPVVELILRSMCSKMEGAFDLEIDKTGTPRQQTPLPKILDSLEWLIAKYPARDTADHVLLYPSRSRQWPDLMTALKPKGEGDGQSVHEKPELVAEGGTVSLKARVGKRWKGLWRT